MIEEQELKFCLVCGEELTGSQSKYCKKLKCKNTAINARMAEKRKSKVVKYPQYKCQHCNYLHQLDFDPTKDLKKFKEFICFNCNN